MEPPHDKQWRDGQVKSLLDEAKDRKNFPPALDSVGAGRINVPEICVELGRISANAIDGVVDEFLSLLLSNLPRLGFKDDEEILAAAFQSREVLFTGSRSRIVGEMGRRGWNNGLEFDYLRTTAWGPLEKMQDKIDARIRRRIVERDLFTPPSKEATAAVEKSSVMKEKDGSINIGAVEGNVSISQNQSGGITAGQHAPATADVPRSLKRWQAIAGIIACIIAILVYFGLTPPKPKTTPAPALTSDIAPAKVEPAPLVSRPEAPPKPEVPPQPKSSSQRKESKQVSNDQRISIGQVTGDVVISNNQSGGITAKSVTISAKRSLAPETADKLRDLLSPYRGSSVKITSLFGDGEAFQYATQFQKVFEAAGWKVDGVFQGAYTVPLMGLLLNIHDEKSYAKNVDVIQLALKHVGLDVGANIDAEAKPDNVELLVGGR